MSEQARHTLPGRRRTLLAVLAAAAIGFTASFAAAWALQGGEGTANAGPDRAPEDVAPPAALTVSADPTATVTPLPALIVPLPASAPQPTGSEGDTTPDTSSGGSAAPDTSSGGAAPVEPASPVVTEETPPIVEDR